MEESHLNIPLRKLVTEEQVQRAYRAKNWSVPKVHEDLRTASKKRLPSGVEFSARSNTHRTINESGLKLVKHFEGFSPEIYICPAGFKTIGYGHKILTHESFDRITNSEAENLLRSDLLQAEKAVTRHITAELSDNQFSALVSFTFNLGAAALQRSSLRHKLNYGLYQESANEFLKWVHCSGRKTIGLVRRRIEEQKLFLR